MAGSSAVNGARNFLSIAVEIDPEAFSFAVMVLALRLQSTTCVVLNPGAFFGAVVVHAFFCHFSIRVVANEGTMTCSAVSAAVSFVIRDDRIRIDRAIEFWQLWFTFDFDVHDARVVVVIALVSRRINVSVASVVSRMHVLHAMARVGHDRPMSDGRATMARSVVPVVPVVSVA
jgi:hypothetical protein